MNQNNQIKTSKDEIGAQKFKIVSEYKADGDQPNAIKTLVNNIKKGEKEQVLLGVTGS